MKRHAVIVAALLLVLSLLNLAPTSYALASKHIGTTIITHGFLLDILEAVKLADAKLEKRAEWVIKMAMAIENQTGKKAGIYILRNGKIYELINREIGNPDIKLARRGFALNDDQEKIVLLDWVSESDKRCEGYAEAAGDALAAYLILGTQGGFWDLQNLHFIGHSRGAVVNSEAIQRLLYFAKESLLPDNIKLDDKIHMTTLDAHPAGRMNDDQVNEFTRTVVCGENSQKQCGVVGWAASEEYKVSHVDNYYQTNQFPKGLSTYSGLNFKLDLSERLKNTTAQRDHSDVHDWYHGTIDLSYVPVSRFKNQSVPSGTYQSTPAAILPKSDSEFRREWYGPEDDKDVGFYFSDIGGGQMDDILSAENALVDVKDDDTLKAQDYVFNDDQEKYCSGTPPGWYFPCLSGYHPHPLHLGCAFACRLSVHPTYSGCGFQPDRHGIFMARMLSLLANSSHSHITFCIFRNAQKT